MSEVWKIEHSKNKNKSIDIVCVTKSEELTISNGQKWLNTNDIRMYEYNDGVFLLVNEDVKEDYINDGSGD